MELAYSWAADEGRVFGEDKLADEGTAALLAAALPGAARGGHVNAMDWLWQALERSFFRDLGLGVLGCTMLEVARGGSLQALRLLMSWGPYSGVRALLHGEDADVIREAAASGHRAMVARLLELEGEAADAAVADGLMKGAAEGGLEDLCRKARTMGAKDLADPFADAAHGGRTALLRLLNEWIIEDGQSAGPDGDVLCGAVIDAIAHGHVDAAVFLRTLGASPAFNEPPNLNTIGGTYGNLLADVVATGDLELASLLREWAAEDKVELGDALENAMYVAAYRGEEEVIKLIHSWGVKVPTSALWEAVRGDQPGSLRVLRDLGADEDMFGYVLEFALRQGSSATVAMLRSWGVVEPSGPLIKAVDAD
jgi:hypothetical protein